MNLKEKARLENALVNGYRTKSNGQKVSLSPRMAKLIELQLASARAKNGFFEYISVDVDPTKNIATSMGPAVKFIDNNGVLRYRQAMPGFRRHYPFGMLPRK
jgi:hypothetical protein